MTHISFKKVFVLTFLVLLLSAFLPIPTFHTGGGTPQWFTPTSAQLIPPGGLPTLVPPTTEPPGDGAEEPRQNTDIEPEERGGGGPWGNPLTYFTDKALRNAVESLMFFVLSTAATILGIAGKMLNVIIDITIVQMSSIIKDLSAITIAWEIFRDLINMTFIFILVYAGIATILQVSSVQTRTVVVRVVIAALLVNFSLFFTNVIVDISNTTTVALYEPLQELSRSTTATSTTFGSFDDREIVIQNSGLSSVLMQSLNLQSIFDPTVDFSKMTTSLIVGTILLLITAFVFFAIGTLLAIRFLVLLVLMITSPIAFMGGTVPFFDSHAKTWWKSLLDQAIFAPVFMLMMLVACTIVADKDFSNIFISGGSSSFAKSTTGGSVLIIVQFALVIGLILTALTTARSTATRTASGALTFGQTLVGKAFGGAGFVGRRIIGRAGNRLSKNEWLQNQAKRGGLVGGFASRMTLRGGSRLATASFDARNTAFGPETGLDKGSGKGGYKKIREAAEKREAEYLKNEITGATVKTQKEHDEAVAKLKAQEEAGGNSDEAQQEVTRLEEELGALEAGESELNDTIAKLTGSIEGLEVNLASTTDPETRAQITKEMEAKQHELAAWEKTNAARKEKQDELNEQVKDAAYTKYKALQESIGGTRDKKGILRGGFKQRLEQEKKTNAAQQEYAQGRVSFYNDNVIGQALRILRPDIAGGAGRVAKGESDDEKFTRLAKKLAKEKKEEVNTPAPEETKRAA